MDYIKRSLFDNTKTKSSNVIRRKEPLDKRGASLSNTSNKRPKINDSHSSNRSIGSNSLSSKSSSGSKRRSDAETIRGKVFVSRNEDAVEQNSISDRTVQVSDCKKLN